MIVHEWLTSPDKGILPAAIRSFCTDPHEPTDEINGDDVSADPSRIRIR